MNYLEADAWDNVAQHLKSAKGISWDGCHKIYILMDDESLADQYECGYGTAPGTQCLDIENPEQALEMIKAWWNQSCSLRFVNSVVRGGHEVSDYSHLIDQFEDEEWDD